MSTSWDVGFAVGCGSILSKANVFAGTSIKAATAPLTVFPNETIALDDSYSVMIWIKYIRDSATVTHVRDSFIGFVDPTTRAVKTGLRITSTGITPTVSDGTTTVNGSTFAWTNIREEWHLWTWSSPDLWNTVDFYIDGDLLQSLNTAAIAGNHTGMWVPLVGLNTVDATEFDRGVSTDPGGSYPDSLTAPFTSTAFSHIPVMVGPYEIATQDAVSSDFEENIRDRTVYARDNTIARVFWQLAENIVDWDRDPRHIIRGISDFSPTAAPFTNGTNTVIRVPGHSGGNSVDLQAFASYGQQEAASPYALVAGMRAQFGFVFDPFFSSSANIPLRVL